MDIDGLRRPCSASGSFGATGSVCARVNAGICGMASVVEASASECVRSRDGMDVMVRVESDCPRVLAFAGELMDRSALDAFEELLHRSLPETTPAQLAAKHGLHTACPVPVAVLKAVEAAASLALPGDCSIELTRVEAQLDAFGKTGPE